MIVNESKFESSTTVIVIAEFSCSEYDASKNKNKPASGSIMIFGNDSRLTTCKQEPETYGCSIGDMLKAKEVKL